VVSPQKINFRLIEHLNKDLGNQSDVDLSLTPRVTYNKSRVFLLQEMLIVAILFVAPLSVHAGFFSNVWHFFSPVADAQAPEMTQNAQTVPLLRAAVHQDPNPSKGGGDILVSEDGALVPDTGPLGGADSPRNKDNAGEISVYIVREGDTLGGIAEMFGVSGKTVLWANDIKDASLIKPGDTLVILPITGVRHVVKKGDTLKSIATKYKGDSADILAYNQLDSEDDIHIGDTVVVPGGEVTAANTPKKSIGGSSVKGGGAAIAGFAKPLKSYTKTQGIHGYNGVDLAAPIGSTVYASAAGTVILAKGGGLYNGGYGNYIVIKHPNGTQTLYAHLSAVSVANGTSVAQGQVIGASGNSGKSTGAHLHFEVRGAKNPF